jgi:hypothetical protein
VRQLDICRKLSIRLMIGERINKQLTSGNLYRSPLVIRIYLRNESEFRLTPDKSLIDDLAPPQSLMILTDSALLAHAAFYELGAIAVAILQVAL